VTTDTETPGRPEEGDGRPEERRWDRRRTVGAIVGGVIVLFIISMLVIGLAKKDIGTSIQDALEEGKRPNAPDATLPVLFAADGIGPAGKEVTLSSLRGKIVVLNFWASWCQPCELEAPILDEVAAKYRVSPQQVVVLGVDVQDLREQAHAFARRNGINYASLRDGSDKAKDAYQVPALPETFVIDQKGRIALKVAGQLTQTDQLTNAIEQLKGS
jgi:cytochrome c biogenesis protein CcmG/thiol:disulfide interchange protein DsbE